MRGEWLVSILGGDYYVGTAGPHPPGASPPHPHEYHPIRCTSAFSYSPLIPAISEIFRALSSASRAMEVTCSPIVRTAVACSVTAAVIEA